MAPCQLFFRQCRCYLELVQKAPYAIHKPPPRGFFLDLAQRSMRAMLTI
jgi:hypothetical protein